METPPSDQSELNASERQPTKKSIMREYLESDDPALKFEYPGGGNHYEFGATHQNFLLLKKKISVKPEAKASVYSYRRNPDHPNPITFEPDVIVKQIRGSVQRSNKIAIQEVGVQRFLYHPHITAFLGTFRMNERLNIVIYPVACGDLGDFMREMCDDWRSEDNAPARPSVRNQSAQPLGGQSTPKGHSRNNSRNTREVGLRPSGIRGESPANLFHWSLTEKTQKLRGWFACLSAALQYLHETGVRHKDIKPANIVIDASGSALLTDFGISRLFPPGTPHITNDQWVHTAEYASPEMMKGPKELRSDPSDVFSLGCVFAEMATVLLRGDLESFSDHRDPEGNTEYYKCLPKVDEWISSGCASPDAPNLENDTNREIFDVLPGIREMLSENPKSRPLTKDLWKIFQNVSSRKCADCDFRLPDTRWKPNAEQIRNTREAFKQHSSLLSARNLRSAQSRDLRSLPEESKHQSFENDLPAFKNLDDHENLSDAPNWVGPRVVVRAPTERTELQGVQASSPLRSDSSIQQIGHDQLLEGYVSVEGPVTPTPNSDGSIKSNAAASSDQTLVYCVQKKSLQILSLNSVDPRRKKELCPLPLGRRVAISSLNGDLIAEVDLGTLPYYRWFAFRRRFGLFPVVCVLFPEESPSVS